MTDALNEEAGNARAEEPSVPASPTASPGLTPSPDGTSRAKARQRRSDPSRGVPPGPTEVDLAADTRAALARGRLLADWWSFGRGNQTYFDLAPAGGHLAQMEGFFGSAELDGRVRTVMGCLQSARFRAGPAWCEPDTFGKALRRDFLRICSWTRRDGRPGGFTYSPLLAAPRSAGSTPIRPGGDSVSLTDLESRYEWTVLQVDIHDFVRSFPPLRRFAGLLAGVVREAAYIVLHPEFSRPYQDDPPGVVSECVFGYSFLPREVFPNVFGFGPGKFQYAVKQFRFLLTETAEIVVQMSFLVAPRSERVLDLRGFDPVYGAVAMIDRLSPRRLGLAGRVHDRLDAVMLGLHGRVHQNLMEDLTQVWEG